jgi:transcriptional regulator with XRE-family HTH domain
MANKNGNTNPSAVLSLSRGAYKRVADKLGCDPSYVSRVARGERASKPVMKALLAEMQNLRSLLNGR